MCPVVAQAFTRAREVAPTRVRVLIHGPTGVGKTALAAEIHRASGRPGVLVEVNCARLGELADSKLFGHVQGAFTGARRDHVGHLQRSSRGTLLLDELALLPENAQGQLLTVLETGRVSPIGASAPIPVDLRIVAATHRDLEAEMDAGRFREDLFHRLVGVQITLPGLAERPRAEIDLLIDTFLGPGRTMTQAARDVVASHALRGNVRSLKKIIEATTEVHHRIDNYDVQHLVLPPVLGRASRTPTTSVRAGDRETVRLAVLAAALVRTGGNVSAASRHLVWPRTTVVGILKRHGLQARDYETWAPRFLTSTDVDTRRQS